MHQCNIHKIKVLCSAFECISCSCSPHYILLSQPHSLCKIWDNNNNKKRWDLLPLLIGIASSNSSKTKEEINKDKANVI